MIWTDVDTARPVNTTTARLIEAAPILTALARMAPGTVASLRECMQGQPQAAAYDREPSTPSNWCWEHQHPTTQCWDDGHTCEGEPIHRHTDPTGEAACTPDRAAQHHHQFMRLADQITRNINALADIAALYPATAEERPRLETDHEPDDWCINHWRNGRRHAPVAIRGTNDQTPRYPHPGGGGYCSWCGSMKALHGIYPTDDFLDKRERGFNITAGMWQIAVTEHQRRNPVRTKAKKAKKSKVRKAEWSRTDPSIP